MSDFPRLAGHSAIVTGGSGGIGRAISRELAAAGANVIVHYHSNKAAAELLVQELTSKQQNAHAVAADISQESDCVNLFAAANDAFGSISILVNNAAIQPVAAFSDIDPDDMGAVLATNVSAPFRLTQLFAAQAETSENGSASVINIGSIEGSLPAEGRSHYAISKSALLMLTRAAALELGPRGIRVNAVSPGLIDRNGLDEDWPDGVHRWQAAAPLGRLGRAEDVANAVTFLASDLAAWVSGHNLVVDGGMSVRPGW